MKTPAYTHIRDPKGESQELRIVHKREPVRYVCVHPAMCGVMRPSGALHDEHTMYAEYCPDCLAKCGR